MNFLELVQNVPSPVVTFKKGILDLEGYAEPGMRARMTGGIKKSDDLVVLYFNFSEFDEHNARFETANYFDKNGNACLTARQANMYKPVNAYYFDAEDDISKYFEITDNNKVALFREYKASGSQQHYIEWLEKELLRLRQLEQEFGYEAD